jgi:hypothetical protein
MTSKSTLAERKNCEKNCEKIAATLATFGGDILPWATFCRATFCHIKKSDILSRDILSGDI